MKMIKKTMIAVAAMAFLASAIPAFAAISVWQFTDEQSDDLALKVDGKQTVRWPFDYKFLEICRIPIEMKVGMFIRVKDCDDKKIVLTQKDCEDQVINKDSDDWPCYFGCVEVDISANFDAELDTKLYYENGDIEDAIDDNWSSSIDPDTIAGDGDRHTVEICVKAWKVKLEDIPYGDSVDIGEVAILARPEV
jgi:hypothetical protein